MAVWSSVAINQVRNDNRWDAEFFRPEHLSRATKLIKAGAEPLGKRCRISSGKTPSQYIDDGTTTVVRSGDLSTPLIYKTNSQPYLRANDVHPTSKLKSGDVLISSIGVGSIGKVGLVTNPNGLATVAEVTVVRSDVYSPEFLFAYLSTQTGLGEIERRVTGATGQQHLNKSEAENILIPAPPSKSVQSKLEDLISSAVELEKKARTAITTAESRMVSALGLDGLDLSPTKCYARNFKDMEAEERFDAEYFNPKYDRLMKCLQSTGDARLGDFVTSPVRRGLQPTYVENGDTIVINSQHIRRDELRLTDNRLTDSKVLNKNSSRARVCIGDVLLNSTGYITVGRSQPVIEPLNAVVDGHVAILRTCLDPVFLSIFLNSSAGYLQTERNWTGSSGQIELRTEAVMNYRIWAPPMKEQKKFHVLYEKGMTARREAADLLEQAKQTVEQLIAGKDKNKRKGK